MTGAAIVAELLRADSQILAIAPAPRIKLGRLPEDVELTALLVRTVSSIDRQPLVLVGKQRVTDRVAVTVRAASYRDQVAAIGAVRRCCHGRTGAIGGGEGVSIRTAGKGPDVDGPGASFEQTQDFRVSFLEPL